MFKIRSPQSSDLAQLETLCKSDRLQELSKNKFFYLCQNIIPYNLRFLPSIHIAVDEKNVIGYITLRCISKSNNCWQIDEVFVLDEFRNRGIGEELLRYVLSVYGSLGIEHFLAEVETENFSALSLFHSCGFRRYAKVGFYEKEIDVSLLKELLSLDKEFDLRIQNNNDLAEIEKLDLSSIPPDLRPALGRSKNHFKNAQNALVLVDRSRNLVVGWVMVLKTEDDSYLIEPLLSPGWTHLYECFLNTVINNHIAPYSNNFKLKVKVVDYLTELTEVLVKSGFLKRAVRELLVRTVWQSIREKKKKTSPATVPGIAPT